MRKKKKQYSQHKLENDQWMKYCQYKVEIIMMTISLQVAF